MDPIDTLDTLRAEARDELDAEIERRCRGGEDPWQFIPDMPTVDEKVVWTLRAETIAMLGLDEARSHAYHPAAPSGAAERFEFGLLRRIALEHPELTTTVWRMLGRIGPRFV